MAARPPHRCSLWSLVRRKKVVLAPKNEDLEATNVTLRAEIEELKGAVTSTDSFCTHMHLEVDVLQKDVENSRERERKLETKYRRLKDQVANSAASAKVDQDSAAELAAKELQRERDSHEETRVALVQEASARSFLLAEVQQLRGSPLAHLRAMEGTDDRSQSSLYSQLAESLTCNVCFDIYTDPTTLPCGHTGCSECFKQCIEREQSCILCKTPVKDDWVAEQGRIYALRDIVEVVRKLGSV